MGYSKLSKTDRDFIKDNCHYMTDLQISKTLNVSIKTVARARRQMGVIKGHGLKPHVISVRDMPSRIEDLKDVREEVEEKKIDHRVDFRKLESEESFRYWANLLIKSVRGKRTRRILNPREWEMFIDEWVAFHEQFEDLTHTEDNAIESIIYLRIRMYNNQKSLSEYDKARENMGNIDIADLNLEKEEDARKLMKFQAIHNASTDLNKEYKELLDKTNQIYRDMNATRKQREEKGKITRDTFHNLCEEFRRRSVRKKEGRLAELLKMATEQSADKLRQTHEFADGEKAPQLLDDHTVELMEQQQLELQGIEKNNNESQHNSGTEQDS